MKTISNDFYAYFSTKNDNIEFEVIWDYLNFAEIIVSNFNDMQTYSYRQLLGLY